MGGQVLFLYCWPLNISGFLLYSQSKLEIVYANIKHYAPTICLTLKGNGLYQTIYGNFSNFNQTFYLLYDAPTICLTLKGNGLYQTIYGNFSNFNQTFYLLPLTSLLPSY